MSDERPTPREQEEAEALARALEGEPSRAPGDALEMAALLRYARGDDVPDAARLARAREAATRAKVVPLHKRRGSIVAMLGAAVAAAAAVLAVVSVSELQHARKAADMSVAAPSASAPVKSSLARLLAAQAEVLAAPSEPLAGLASATADHRRDLLARMHERYGAAP